MGNIGMPEIIVILLIIILLFGAKKIPELAQSIGKGLKEFKKAQKDAEIDETSASNSDTKQPKS